MARLRPSPESCTCGERLAVLQIPEAPWVHQRFPQAGKLGGRFLRRQPTAVPVTKRPRSGKQQKLKKLPHHSPGTRPILLGAHEMLNLSSAPRLCLLPCADTAKPEGEMPKRESRQQAEGHGRLAPTRPSEHCPTPQEIQTQRPKHTRELSQLPFHKFPSD